MSHFRSSLADLAGDLSSSLDLSDRRRVLVIYTGGTMGMRRDESRGGTLVPVAGYLSSQIAAMQELHESHMPQYTLIEYDPLLDSADMGPKDWVKMGKDIVTHYDDFDGFVIIHGTDTMAYTASALSFMLENLSKPVILTGSQVPFCEAYTDARRNFIVSIILAGMLNICEVCIFFNKQLLRGNRAVKHDNDALDAFISPNFPPLARLGVGITIDEALFMPYPERSLSGSIALFDKMEANIAVLRLVPGFHDECIERIAAGNTKALVLMLYGTGNVPASAVKRRGLIDALRSAAHKMLVIVCTQCLHGATDLNAYAAGQRLLQIGVMSAGDMTVEATVAKISYLVAHDNLPHATIRKMWKDNLRGERSTGAIRVRPPKGLIARKRNFPRLSRSEIGALFESFAKTKTESGDIAGSSRLTWKEFCTGMEKIDAHLVTLRQRARLESFEEDDDGHNKSGDEDGRERLFGKARLAEEDQTIAIPRTPVNLIDRRTSLTPSPIVEIVAQEETSMGAQGKGLQQPSSFLPKRAMAAIVVAAAAGAAAGCLITFAMLRRASMVNVMDHAAARQNSP